MTVVEKTDRRLSLSRWRLTAMIIVDLLMILLEFLALRSCWEDSRTGMFYYYTQDSNLLAMLVCILSVVTAAVLMIRGGRTIPRWLALLRLTATGCVTLTLLIAAFVLVPLESHGSLLLLRMEFVDFMLSGSMLYLHTVCPLLMIFSLLFLWGTSRLKLRHALLAVIPTILYGVILLRLNITGRYAGPYPFLYVHRQPVFMTVIWCAAIVGGTFLIMQGLRLLSRFTAGRFWWQDKN